jgi:hypothetical protein
MPLFETDLDVINQMVDEIEEDIERTTQRIAGCVDRLDELALKVARASKLLREQVTQQQVSSSAGIPTTH